MKLYELVQSIMTSVSIAQDEIEKQTIENISQYFDGQGNPEMLSVRIPRTQEDAQSGEQTTTTDVVNIPLLSLLQHNPIKIKEMQVSFEFPLEEVGKLEESGDGPDANAGPANNLMATSSSNQLKQRRRKRIMETDISQKRSFFSSGKSRNATVNITFESGEPTEGYLKLNGHLQKLF